MPLSAMGVPNTKTPANLRKFGEVVPIFEERNYTITGVTKNSSGALLGGCTVQLFNAVTKALEQVTVSDGSGNFSFVVDKTQTWFLVAYLAGAPDVAGTSLNTLAAA